MLRVLLLCFSLVYVLTVQANAPALNVATLHKIDRAALEASVHGDVLALERLLAPDFVAHIQVPGDSGPQTLSMNRAEFLLYAWQARAMADGYRVRPQPARYNLAADGRSAVGVQILEERLRWQGQPLTYTSRRTTRYAPQQGRILINRLDVQILDWR